MSAAPATMEEMDVFVAEVRGSLESNQVKVQYKYRAAANGKRKPGEWVTFEGLVDASETAAAGAQFFVVQIRDEDDDMAVALVPQKYMEYSSLEMMLLSAQRSRKVVKAQPKAQQEGKKSSQEAPAATAKVSSTAAQKTLPAQDQPLVVKAQALSQQEMRQLMEEKQEAAGEGGEESPAGEDGQT